MLALYILNAIQFFSKNIVVIKFPIISGFTAAAKLKHLKTRSKLWRKQEYWITWWEFIIVSDRYAPKFSAKQYNLREYICHKPKNCSGVISLAISCRLVTWCWRRNLGHTCISSGSAKPLFSIPSQTQNNGPHNLKSEMQCNYMFRDSHPQAKPGQVPGFFYFSKKTTAPLLNRINRLLSSDTLKAQPGRGDPRNPRAGCRPWDQYIILNSCSEQVERGWDSRSLLQNWNWENNTTSWKKKTKTNKNIQKMIWSSGKFVSLWCKRLLYVK